MLDNLRSSLGAALKKLVGASDVNEELIDSLCKDVQRALLQSDVNVRLVLTITQNLKKRSLEESPPKGLSRKNHIVSILYDELSRLMGYKGDLAAQNNQLEEQVISFVPGKLNTVLMFGIQGSGKTTVTAKLARWLTKHGYHVGVVGADTWRPGALTQLKMNCIKINVEVFGDESTKNAPSIVKNGIAYFRDAGADVVIIDSLRLESDVESIRADKNNLIVYIKASPEVRYNRLTKRNEKVGEAEMSFEQFTKEEQAATEVLIPKIGEGADFIINNEGSFKEFESQVDEFYKKYLVS